MWRLLFLLNYIIIYSYAQNSVPLATQNLLVTKFDLIVDEDVNNDDPRIKSIVYSAKSYKQGWVTIYYVNPNAEILPIFTIFTYKSLIFWHTASTIHLI